MRRHVLLLASVALATLLACGVMTVSLPSTAPAAPSVQNGEVAFVGLKEISWSPYVTYSTELKTVHPAGSNEVGINPTVYGHNPAWSPDGSKIAFDDPGSGIGVVKADGTNLFYVPEPDNGPRGYERYPTWSPDGTKLAFVSVRWVWSEIYQSGMEIRDIYTTKLDGSEMTNLTNNTEEAAVIGVSGNGEPITVDYRHLDWSPDDTKIAFSGSGLGASGYGIGVINADGTGVAEPLPTPAYGDNPDWSPDGQKIVFDNTSGNEANCDGNTGTCIMNADGSGQTWVPEYEPMSYWDAAWSPDGTKLVFAGCGRTSCDGNPTTDDIYTMNPDGSNVVRLTSTGGYQPSWQPNTAPVVTPLRPVPGSTTTDRTPRVQAKVTDVQTDLAKRNITLTLDDHTISRRAFSYDAGTDRLQYTPLSNLSYGRHTVKITAVDSVGLSTTKQWRFWTVRP